MFRTLAIGLILLPVMTAAAQEGDVPARLIEQAASDFVTAAARSWKDFSVCDRRSKTDDKRAFLSRSFGKEVFPADAKIAWKELHVSEEGASSSLHLGLIAVTFQEHEKASGIHTRLMAAQEPFLNGTKILTRYKALIHNNTVLILYSETFNHKALRYFFDTVALPQ